MITSKPAPPGLRQAPGETHLFTKCGRRWDRPEEKQYSDLRPAEIRKDCEAALRRLGVEVIDLLQSGRGIQQVSNKCHNGTHRFTIVC